MREIKFRAWESEYGEMSYSDNWTCLFNGAFIGDDHIMQYTGLKDSKRTKEYPEGQDIYESDIIEADGKIFTVVYDRASFAIKAPHMEKVIALLLVAQHNGCQVIGNIYEHNHLLEANK